MNNNQVYTKQKYINPKIVEEHKKYNISFIIIEITFAIFLVITLLALFNESILILLGKFMALHTNDEAKGHFVEGDFLVLGRMFVICYLSISPYIIMVIKNHLFFTDKLKKGLGVLFFIMFLVASFFTCKYFFGAIKQLNIEESLHVFKYLDASMQFSFASLYKFVPIVLLLLFTVSPFFVGLKHYENADWAYIYSAIVVLLLLFTFLIGHMLGIVVTIAVVVVALCLFCGASIPTVRVID